MARPPPSGIPRSWDLQLRMWKRTRRGARTIERLPARAAPCRDPIPLGDGLFRVDATWRTLQPAELAPGVRTVGELEVIAHIERGKPLVDTRLQHFFSGGTTPRARNISHKEILEHVDQLDPTLETVFFCDGRQCS